MKQPKNLSQLKAACDHEGARLLITNTARPQATRVTAVTKVHGRALVTRARNDAGQIVEHSYLEWGKAADWTFTDDGAVRHDKHVDARGNRLPGDPDPRFDITIKVLDPLGVGMTKTVAPYGSELHRIPDLFQVTVGPGKFWVNCESEGTQCSIGPFVDDADADHFRALMFTDPDYGHIARDWTTGEKMTVSQFQAAFRADFMHPPAPHWGAR